jgi:hypothetical protein
MRPGTPKAARPTTSRGKRTVASTVVGSRRKASTIRLGSWSRAWSTPPVLGSVEKVGTHGCSGAGRTVRRESNGGRASLAVV